MSPLLLVWAVAAGQPAGGHDGLNPLYAELRTRGLVVGPETRAPLPAPTLPDGLSPADQRAKLDALIGTDYTFGEFTRPSAVAPYLLRSRDVPSGDPAAPARGLDVGFVAYGDFSKTADEKFLDRLVRAGRGGNDGSGSKGRRLTAADLEKRKIAPPGADSREGYGLVEFDILDRVRLRAVGRAVWSRTADSVVAAAEIDPRFRGDPEFPDEWQPLSKGPAGLVAGAARPYSGAALYLKVTKLAEPAGALFVEQHIVYSEPAGWFDGVNLLRSKLPPVVQGNVRAMRREWQKAGE